MEDGTETRTTRGMPTRRRAKPAAIPEDGAKGPASERTYYRLRSDLKRRWETWCAWHRVDPSKLIEAFIETQVRGFVVQQRPGSGGVADPVNLRLALEDEDADRAVG